MFVVSAGVAVGGCGECERWVCGGGCLGFEEGSRHVGLVADVVVLVVLVAAVIVVVVVAVVVAGRVEGRGGGDLSGERSGSLFSTHLLRRVVGYFWIHLF